MLRIEEKRSPVSYTYQTLEARFRNCPIIPAVLMEKVSDAVPIANALLKGGISQMEILVHGDAKKQECAMSAIAAIRKHVDTQDMAVGAGTINTENKMRNAVDAGAQFLLSAECDRRLLDRWSRLYFLTPYYPGAVNLADIKEAVHFGVHGIKLYPIDQLVYPDRAIERASDMYDHHFLLSFDKTEPANMEYLVKHSKIEGIVACWLTPEWVIKERKWDVITQIAMLAMEAVKLAKEKKQIELQEKISEINQLAKIEPAMKDQTGQAESQSEEKTHQLSRIKPAVKDQASQTENHSVASFNCKKTLAVVGFFAASALAVGVSTVLKEADYSDDNFPLPPCTIM
ncbi:MAG: hypothetical protein ACD_45C00356G0003 [uncultured bacterium]|nr:MAG: hypothetical protein ACD_45C00356G0003 [uncultured bacterium]